MANAQMNARPLVFYINLATRLDRREFMEQQFAATGLVAERIEAVSSSEVTVADLASSSGSAHPWSMSHAEVACMRSHCRAWQLALDRGQPYAIVFEDDVVFGAGLRQILDCDLTPIVGDGILRLERTWRKVGLGSAVATLGPREVRRIFTSDIGTAAYVISAPMIRRALEELPRSGLPVDAYFFTRRGELIGTPLTLQVDPAPCTQLRFVPVQRNSTLTSSDIKPARGGRRTTLGFMARLHELGADIRYWGRSARTILFDRDARLRGRRRIDFVPE